MTAAGDSSFVPSYNFIPIPSAADLTAPFQDGPPVGHSGASKGQRLWSGTLPIVIETATPLLLPDDRTDRIPVDERQEAGASVRRSMTCLSTRRGADGAPFIPPTAIKGMLRSAIEALTGSRFPFPEQGTPLGMRMPTADALKLHPAVVTGTGPARELLIVLELWDHRLDDRLPRDRRQNVIPVTAQVSVPTELAPRVDPTARSLARHEVADLLDTREVDAIIKLTHHRGRQQYCFWQVTDIGPVESALDEHSDGPLRSNCGPPGDSALRLWLKVRGRLHWTGARFDRKHDERLVVTDVLGASSGTRPTDYLQHTRYPVADLLDQWRMVLDSYLSQYPTDEDRHNSANGGYIRHPDRWRDLPAGRTLHVGPDPITGRGWVGTPAMIGRFMFESAPADLLAAAGREPAATISTLSFADRLFGWAVPAAHTARDGGYRGHVTCTAATVAQGTRDPVTTHRDPVPLAALNTPKPSQYRTYVRDQDGRPVGGGQQMTAAGGYRRQQRLAGRKVYAIDAATLGDQARTYYWAPPRWPADEAGMRANTTVRQTNVQLDGKRRYREYLAPRGFKPNVTVAAKDWVRPGGRFLAALQLDRVTDDQLGALLWLLTLPSGHYLRLGRGKPLGFGVVTLALDPNVQPTLYTEQEVRSAHLALRRPAPPDDQADCLDQCRATFDDALAQTPQTRQTRDAFLTAARPVEGPVHAPRRTPAPQAESYEWWVLNERGVRSDGQHQPGRDPRRLALPPLTDQWPRWQYDPTEASRPDQRRTR